MNAKMYLLLTFLAVTPLIIASCSKNGQVHGPVEKVDPTTIRVFKDALENIKASRASATEFPDQLTLMGKIGITEDRTTIIPARVAGRIESIFFASGESVIKGQALATLFSPDFVAAKEEYLQSLKQANGGGYRGSDPSDFANLAQMARKKLETMGLSKADIQALPSNPTSDPSHTLLSIRAPRSGVLIAKNAVLGNLVNVGDTLFMVGDMSKVWFAGDIYPEDLTKVHKGQEVIINAVGVDHPIHGEIYFISPLVDPNSRSIKIRALMDNPNSALKADMYVQGNLILNKKMALVVPTSSLVRVPDGLVVYKRVSPPTIEKNVASIDYRKIPVQVGNEQQGLSSIVSGLSEGDEVVSDGAWLLEAALNSSEGN